MYKVYCDDNLIYCRNIDSLMILDANLELELGKTGLFTFTIYPNNIYYNSINKLKSIITILQNDKVIFKGRVLNEEVGFYNQKIITCEGVLAFLLDSVIRPTKYENIKPIDLLTKLLEEHNKYVDNYKKFKVGNISTKIDKLSYNLEEHISCFGAIQSGLVNQLGGYLIPRYENDGVYIDLINDFTSSCNQPINFGVNLLDLVRTTKGEDIVTSIIPIGDNNGTQVKLSLGNSEIEILPGYYGVNDYIYDKNAVNKYGWITTFIKFDDITNVNDLKKVAVEFLKGTNNLSTTIEIKAVDLSLLNYKYDSFKLGSQILVHSKHHLKGELSDKKYLVDKLSINIINPQNSTLNITSEFKISDNKSFLDQSNNKVNNISLGNSKTIEGINKGVVANTTDINNLNDKVIGVNTDLNNINAEITSLKASIDTMNTTLGSLNTSLNDYKTKVDSSLTDLTSRLKAVEEKLNNTNKA